MTRADPVYGKFAKYYDFEYEELVDYGRDVRFLEALFRMFLPRRAASTLDLGCGIGSHAIRLARRGHRVIGLDRSRPQLAIARRKAKNAGVSVRFVHGDMARFDLRSTFDVAFSLFGGFGYVLKTRDVLGTFRSVRHHLAPDGVFAFEFWHSPGARPAPYQSWLHRVGPGLEIVRLAESRFNPKTRLLPIEFRFFVLKGRRLLDRFAETHTLRTYTLPEIRRLLHQGGFELLKAYEVLGAGGLGFRPVRKKTFRILAVCRPAKA